MRGANRQDQQAPPIFIPQFGGAVPQLPHSFQTINALNVQFVRYYCADRPTVWICRHWTILGWLAFAGYNLAARCVMSHSVSLVWPEVASLVQGVRHAA